jgi:FixJ family two-component response regulator
MATSGRTIAIVEDDAGLHKAFERVLSAAGHMPTIFDSAEALLQAPEMEGIECYVLDVHLPGKSGIELARELSAAGSRVPIIFITAHDEPSVRAAVQRCGAAALLIKPFAGRKLLETLATVFERNT